MASAAGQAQDPSAARAAARQAARSRAAPAPAAAGQDGVAVDPVAERKKRLEARYATSRASQSPQDAGIPLGKGAAARGRQRATAPRPDRRLAGVAAAGATGDGVAQAAAAQPAVPPPPPTAPVAMKGNPIGDALANELVRAGDGYVFKGSLNGKPVLFLLNDNTHGLVVPAAVAVSHGLVPAASPAAQGAAEMYTPVQSMSVGTHPVSAVMARITASKSPYVQVGVDALQAFKVVLENGHRMLVPSPVE